MDKNTKEKVDQLALLTCQEADFWEICNKVKSEKLWKEYNNFKKKVEQFAKENLPDLVFNAQLCGSDSSVSHYDIDEALVKKFSRDIVNPDSESGMFSACVNKKNVDKVSKFLKTKFPSLRFEVDYPDYVEGNYFRNWNHAKEYVQKNNLTPLPVPVKDESLKRMQEIQAELNKIKKDSEKKIDELTKEMSNLF